MHSHAKTRLDILDEVLASKSISSYLRGLTMMSRRASLVAHSGKYTPWCSQSQGGIAICIWIWHLTAPPTTQARNWWERVHFRWHNLKHTAEFTEFVKEPPPNSTASLYLNPEHRTDIVTADIPIPSTLYLAHLTPWTRSNVTVWYPSIFTSNLSEADHLVPK